MLKALTATSCLGLAVASLLTGCPDRSISEVNPEQGRVEYKDIPVTVNRDIDILFLIDDSPSMADKQRNLAANFPQFINVLNTIQGGLPNVHIGIATSDMGSLATGGQGPNVGTAGTQGGCVGTGKAGKLQVKGGASVNGVFISDTLDGTTQQRVTNYQGALATTFATMATGVGVNGCGFEQHLEGIKAALDNNATNAGFIRDKAFLAIIIIADEDDCSLADPQLLQSATTTFGPLESFRCTQYGVTCDVGGATPAEMGQVGPKSMCHSNESGTELTKVQRYIDFLKGFKAEPTDVIVALIGGPATPVATELRAPQSGAAAVPALAHSCSYVDATNATEVADSSVRQTQFINAFPNRSTFQAICNNDLSDGLVLIAQLLKSVIGSPCIDGELAVPFDCSVSDVTDPGKPTQHETVLPECTDTGNNDTSNNGQACWAIVADTTSCPTGTNLSLKVKRSGMAAPANDHVIANCVTVATNGMGSGSN